jgi:hypothetical protein
MLDIFVPLVLFAALVTLTQTGGNNCNSAGVQLPGKGSGGSGISGKVANTFATHVS